MLLWKNYRHTGMDLRDELIRLACDNRASAQPLPRFGIFPVFPESGKGERAVRLSWRSRTVAFLPGAALVPRAFVSEKLRLLRVANEGIRLAPCSSYQFTTQRTVFL
jgi:hypothetical protein